MADGTTSEPSIEEILASIRKIISDDDGEPEGQDVHEMHQAAVSSATEAEPAAQAWPESHDEEDILELTDVVAEDSAAPHEEPATVHEAETSNVIELSPQEFSPPQPINTITEKPSEPSMPSEEGGIITDRAMAAATGAFAKLSHETDPPERTSGDGRTVEDITRELLRPMLREWMDQNLAPLVERLVERELRKITRKAEDL